MAINHTSEERFGKVGVLMGGPSSEREISLKSGKAVFGSLKGSGLDAVAIDIGTDSVEENIRIIKARKIDCAFLALHGRFGEDGSIQEILESLDIPYTGSGVSASRLAMDKIASRRIFEANGISVPAYQVVDKISYSPDWSRRNNPALPLVIKPATHGSSIGLSIVDRNEDIDKAMDIAFGFDNRVLVEEYIKGRELTVGILSEVALPVIEIIPKKRFFDYEAKYLPGMTDYKVPAVLEQESARSIQEIALSAHRLLGCFGCSRVDMMLNEAGRPFILEVNTIPGLTDASLLPKAAKLVGIEFDQLCLTLIKLAYEKTKAKFTA